MTTLSTVGLEIEDALPALAERRISNQLTRAYRGTYGAKTGWRSIVRSVAREMMSAGVSPENVSRIFEQYVLNHPAGMFGDPMNIVTGKLHSRMLVELANQCISEISFEPAVSVAP